MTIAYTISKIITLTTIAAGIAFVSPVKAEEVDVIECVALKTTKSYKLVKPVPMWLESSEKTSIGAEYNPGTYAVTERVGKMIRITPPASEANHGTSFAWIRSNNVIHQNDINCW